MQKNKVFLLTTAKGALVNLLLLANVHHSFSQPTDSARHSLHFGGAVLVTNNGISLIPSFSLGEPAAIFALYAGKRKLSFEPELRFSLEGKPWSFLFWWRYRLVDADRFRLVVGAHPAMNFRTVTSVVNGESKEVIVARRYLAGELSPNFLVARNTTVGVYYLYSHGIDREAVRNTHFLTLNSNFSNIGLFSQLYLRFTPQVYYLRQNDDDGFYLTSTVTVARRRFPLSLMTIFNKTIQTDIAAGENFVWNISLVYSFNRSYVAK